MGDSGTLLTSSDGITWTSRDSKKTKQLMGVVYGNSTFLVVSSASNGSITSSDGSSWTLIGNASHFSGVTYGNSIFVATGTGREIYTSSNGISWTSHNGTSLPNSFSGITYIY